MRAKSQCKNENDKKVLSLHSLHGLQSACSAFWGDPSYREFGYSKMTEKRSGPAPGVHPIEVSVKRGLTVNV